MVKMLVRMDQVFDIPRIKACLPYGLDEKMDGVLKTAVKHDQAFSRINQVGTYLGVPDIIHISCNAKGLYIVPGGIMVIVQVFCLLHFLNLRKAFQENISRAAARLYLSQPTLTKFLKKIEGEFGTALFDRVGKRMLPTKAGLCCIEKAKDILELHEQMNQRIRILSENDHDCVRIGTSASRGEFFVERILPSVIRKYPQVRFSLILDAKAGLVEKLEKGELDMIFVSNHAERPYMESARNAREEMVLVVPKEHELMKKAKRADHFPYPYVELSDWISCPFICASPRMTTGQYTRLLFEHYGYHPKIVLEVGSLPMIYSAVNQRIGITIAPSMPLCQKEHQELRYLSFEDEQNIQWYFTAITKSQISLHPAYREIIKLVKNFYYNRAEISVPDKEV